MKFLVLALSLAPTFANGQAMVEGKVVNRLTGAGIADVYVDLRSDIGPQNIHTTRTDSSGAFLLLNVKEGVYRATFSDTKGRLYATHSGAWEGPIRVPAAGSFRLDAEMQPPGTLKVRVVDGAGKPVVHADVTTGVGQLANTEETGEDGVVLFELKGGLHGVSAGPSEDLHPPDSLTWQVPETQVVLVRGGAETSIEMRLRTIPLSVNRVHGVVLDEAGKPVASALVNLVAVRKELPAGMVEECVPTSCFFTSTGGVTLPQAEASVKSGDNGAFEFNSVAAGAWRFQVEVRSQDGASLLRGSTLAKVSRDVSGLEIRLARAFPLKVVMEGQAASGRKADFEGSAELVSLDEPALDSRGLLDKSHFSLPEQIRDVFPGRYSIRVDPSRTPGFYPASVFLGSQDVLGREFTLNGASPPLRIVYRDGAGRFRAVIENLGPALLMLYPQTPDDVHIIRGSECDKTCEIGNIPPGDYYAVALLGSRRNEDIRRNQEVANPAFLHAIISNTVSVRIAAGVATELTLPAARWPE